MQIFWRLVLAHLLADFTFQTNAIASWKRRSLAGDAVHVLIFFLCSAALCFPFLGQPWLSGGIFSLNGWAVLAVLSVLHFAEDAWRVLSIQRLNSPDSFLFFLWDQFFHLALIFILVPYRPGGTPSWVLYAVLFVLLTHFANIVIYFIEKDLFGRPAPNSQEKYYSMAERLVTALLLLLPGFWALTCLLVWAVRIFLRRYKREFDFSVVNIIVGNVLALAVGLIARAIHY